MAYPPGSCHFPQYGEEFFKQLTAERCITRVVRGFPKQVWEKDPSRNNEALDCRVYARAAASIYGLDRMSDYKWRSMEKSLGQEVIIPTKGLEMPVPATRQQAQTGQTTQKPKRKPRVPQRKAIKADDPYL